MEIINTANPPQVISPSAVPSNTSIKFRAKIRNQNGATSDTFLNQFRLDNNINDPYTSEDPLNGLGAGVLSSFITSAAIPSVSVGSHSLQVCADMPPPKPGTIPEANTTGNAEDNNCLTTPFSFSVVTPITVELECEKAGGVFDKNYCVIDYSQASSLKWTTNATSCSWITPPSDTTGTASGNTLSLSNLLNKLSFKYQLECTR